MSVILAPIHDYVLAPLQNSARLFAEDMSTVNASVELHIRDLTGSEKFAKVIAVVLSVLTLAVPYFLLPWQLVLGVMLAYQVSQLRLPSFERGVCVATLLDMGRQLAFFAVKNLTKQAGAVAHVGTAAGTGVVALMLLFQASAN